MRLLVSAGVLSGATGAYAGLTLTEIMQSNVTGVMDDLNDFPDSWVELFNDGETAINLEEYSIGLKKEAEKAWQLPAMEVEPGGYVVVYCDKVATGLHTDFRLESNKEGNVFLFRDGEQIQKLSHPAFPAPDIAYGLDAESGEWGYEFVETPGRENSGGICPAGNILGAPVFSMAGGLFDGPVSLSLALPDGAPDGAVIHYTLDCSLPSADSPVFTDGTVLELDESTVVRAVVTCAGWLSPFASTQSYIFPNHEIKLPVVSLVTDDGYLYSDDIGILAVGPVSWRPNYREKWRRPLNVELFPEAGAGSVVNQLSETAVQGNFSRVWPLKSLKIYANKRFGEKRFTYEFFPEQKPGLKKFKSFSLRNSGNDFAEAYMRDAVIQRTVGAAIQADWMAHQPAVVYINGVYKGIINIRERSNEDYVYTNYDELEEIDMVEHWGHELKEGSIDSFLDFKQFYNEDGHTAEEYAGRVCVEEFMDIILANAFYSNRDFPGNNTVLWRPAADGGRWRLIMKDTDAGIGLKSFAYGCDPYDYPTLTWLYKPDYDSRNTYGNNPAYTRLFMQLAGIDEFRQAFIDRAYAYMGDFLNARATTATIDEIYSQIGEEWYYHQQLYDEVDADNLTVNTEYMKEWLSGRNDFFPRHFAETYGLGDLSKVELVCESADLMRWTVNGVANRTGTFEGYYPQGRRIVIGSDAIVEDDLPDESDGIEDAEGADDVEEVKPTLLGWKVYSPREDADPEVIFQTKEPVLDIDFPIGYGDVKIEALVDTSGAVIGIEAMPAEAARLRVYDIYGRLMPDANNLPAGLYLFKQGKKAVKRIIR